MYTLVLLEKITASYKDCGSKLRVEEFNQGNNNKNESFRLIPLINRFNSSRIHTQMFYGNGVTAANSQDYLVKSTLMS